MRLSVAEARPRFTAEEAGRIAREVFGIEPAEPPAPLPSDRDQNFRVVASPATEAASGPPGPEAEAAGPSPPPPGPGDDAPAFVLKLASQNEDPAVLELQHRALAHARKRDADLALPRLRRTREGEELALVRDGSGRAHRARMVTWLPGRPLAGVRPRTGALLAGLGAYLGRLDRALEGFEHPAAERSLKWDLARGPEVVKQRIELIEEPDDRRLLERFLMLCWKRVVPGAEELPEQVIHGDANDHNLLVRVDGPEALRDAVRPGGIIDFGDMVRSRRVNEVAIACAYLGLEEPDPLGAAARVVSGYHRERPLEEAEVAALFPLVALRLCVSVTVAAEQKRDEPDDAYLTVSEAGAWRLLRRLSGESPDLAHYRFREACGMAPVPGSPAVVSWIRDRRDEAAPVLDPDPRDGPAVVLDFSPSGTEFGDLGIDAGPERWWARIRERIDGAAVGLGRYDEPRTWYTSEAFRGEAEVGPPGLATPADAPDPRTVHLGVDLFAEPGTPVRAPLEGRVHSVADNAAPLDYGPTVILQHDADGTPFWTLYGHLAPDVLETLAPGDRIEAGQAFASVGAWPGNGGWAPHLHFQIVVDLLGREGEYPGVAAPSEAGLWKALSPDPNLLLGIPGLEPARRGRSVADLVEARAARLGPGLSVSYRRPLKIVRGWMQHLYDEEGRPHLDCVNNVAHVGHAHPRVVEAERRQAAVLNTNTRYLHDALVEYAERLAATLPDRLSVVWLVCTGSEANELALRMARSVTGSRETLVLDGAYHGNTGGLVEISPYKYKGPGGSGPPPWVHEMPMPDPYRGMYTGRGEAAGRSYAEHVETTARRLRDEDRGPATFIAEAMMGCGGQIVPPEGFLRRAFEAVREAGGVCIADEVQTGFGRVGTHFWAFEAQGAVPDIVSMGKPIGNGHPLAAVVTTPEVARAFETGMEYFNTFGGNPVACRVGMAVLDVIEEEGLQERARSVGETFLEGLRALAGRHPLIGDVRGSGLFLGVELVTDPEIRDPATAHARYVVERLRDHRILLSTDGPDANVIKIKPPLQFGARDAERVLETMDAVLAETPLVVG